MTDIAPWLAALLALQFVITIGATISVLVIGLRISHQMHRIVRLAFIAFPAAIIPMVGLVTAIYFCWFIYKMYKEDA